MAFLWRRASATTVGLVVGAFVVGSACGFGLATRRARSIVAAGEYSTRVLIVKIPEEFFARAFVRGDANAARCLDALARQKLLPELAAAARRNLQTLREAAADERRRLSPDVVEAVNGLGRAERE